MHQNPFFYRDRLNYLMDPLSEVLSRLSTHNSVFAGLKAGGDWAIDFPPPDGIKFNALVKGGCWLRVEGIEQPTRLESGDCFLLSRKRAFSLCSDLSLQAIDSDEIYRHAVDGIAHYGTADTFFLIGGRFGFGEEARLLFDGLPPVAVVKRGSDQASVMSWALQRLAHELATPSPGNSIVVQHLGHIMLVQMLRLYQEQDGNRTPSWLLAVSDPRLGAAIQAIHANPSHTWTVEGLAKVASVSRSTLALRFKQKAGLAPLEYVSHWRMQLAAQSLRDSRATIFSIAQSLGYGSDSAFSHAFKRVMKCSPRKYREKNGITHIQ